MSVSCPSANDLRHYLSGRTSDAQMELLENHFADCTRCQGNLEGLTEEPDSIGDLVGEAVGASARQAERLRDASQSAYLVRDGSGHHGDSEGTLSSVHELANMIANYRIMECIGQGGMGSVYRAMQVHLNRQVALKVLKSERKESAEAHSRFAREMELLGRLDHPHIVRAFDAGKQDGLPYFAMEFVSGVNLNQLVVRLGPLPVPEACHIVRLAASALQYAHDQQVIHRDVKPSNLMITAEGNVKLLDLGLAQIFDIQAVEAISQTNQALGTLAYMSPEQLCGRHQVTLQSDIFSLGVTFHELLTGQRPFERPGLPSIVSNLRSLRPDVNDDLTTLVGEMIALAPSERPASMAEVESRLGPIAAPVNLSALVAEYYCWNKRGQPASIPELAQAETRAVRALSTDKQTVPLGTLIPPPVQRTKQVTIVKWAYSLALLSCVAAVFWMAFGKKGPSLEPRPLPLPKVASTVSVEVIAVGPLAEEALENDCVLARNIETQAGFFLKVGPTSLPPGRYLLEYDGPMKFQENGRQIEIATGTSRLKINATLTQNFQFPDIPDQGSQTFTGHFWREGWIEKNYLFFNLYLEVLDVIDEANAPAAKWLKIEIMDTTTKYRETAYIKVDTENWKRDQLVISEGWIEAESSEIETFMTDRGQTHAQKSIVVRFDLDHDLLDGRVPLPPQRLSTHDVIALFFGTPVGAAAQPINTVRAGLSGERNSWFDDTIDTGHGPALCYVASSSKQGVDLKTTEGGGYLLARRTDPEFVPFGFVKLQVHVPSLITYCQMTKFSPPLANSKTEVLRFHRQLEELRQNEFDPIDEDTAAGLVPKPFDLATLPDKPSFIVWQGDIRLDPQHSETIVATARMLDSEQIGDREYRWIEVEVKSSIDNGPDYWEAARVQIDTAAYEDSNRFVIRPVLQETSKSVEQLLVGCIAFGDKESVFRIPFDGNLDSLLDLRLQLPKQQQFDRIGVVDVLAMLFNAPLKPTTSVRTPAMNISSLRPQVSAMMSGQSRDSGQLELWRDKTGRVVECKRFQLHAPSGQLQPPSEQLNYSFLRSSQIPFGFVAVQFNMRQLSISLEMDSKTGSADWSSSAFGTTSELATLLRQNIDRLRPPKNNWRVWTWSEAGKTYKAWAEFGGTIDESNDQFVLLRKAAGMEAQVPMNLLLDEDRDYANGGRKAGKRNWNPSQRVQPWEAFADHIR